MSVTERVQYSEAFKLQVLRELGSGKFPSLRAAARAYGIGGPSTIGKWIRRYGRTELLSRTIRVETPKERSELKRLRERVAELEKALADAHIEGRVAEAYLQIACQRAGIEDVAAFKKKHAGRR